MNPEQEVFQRKSVVFDQLIPFGFKKTSKGYALKKDFMDGRFRAEILINKNGDVSGKAIDLDVKEEYLPIRVDSRIGAYVRSVRQAYIEILQQIADACFVQERFIYPQTNRIANQIEILYGEKPDYPFTKYPDFAVFRYPANRKWYGLVTVIPKKTLVSKNDPKSTDNALVEALNLKIDPDQLDELLAIEGIYPCYHMNQKSWVSILLDDSVPDQTILNLLDTSRNFALRKKSKRESK